MGTCNLLHGGRLTPSSTVGALAAVLGCASSLHGGAPGFQGLGDLPGGDFYSFAFDVSADGSVVAGRSRNELAGSYSEATIWTSGGGLVGLGDLDGGTHSSVGYGISGNGLVVVGRGNTGSGEAFRWTSGTGLVGLGDLPGGDDSQAFAASFDGAVVVGSADCAANGSPPCEAFRWTSGGGMVGLGDLPGSSIESDAQDVSADGSVVVGWGTTDAGKEAFRWTSGGGMVGLGHLPGMTSSQAFGVSPDGSVVVGRSSLESASEAFRWTSATGMLSLGQLPGGSQATALSVSADGSAVVGGSESFSGYQAMIWDQCNGMRSLFDVLVNDYGLDLTGWSLTQANDISADGTTIVGHGTNPDGDTEGWVAVLPPDVTSSCPWDCDGSNDGAVNVSDLLALLADFDVSNPPCDGFGCCDYDGNGCVDVSDLLKLLAHYDPAGIGCP